MTLEKRKEIATEAVTLIRRLEVILKLLESCSEEAVEEISKEADNADIIEELKITEVTEVNIEVVISKLFRDLGIPTHIKGYGFLKDGILLAIEDKKSLEQITKTVYPTIARKNQTTPSKVERGIRHAIEVAWKRGNTKVQNELFGYSILEDKGKPTNSEFLSAIAYYITLEFKKMGAVL